ncbi:tetrapyrrole biosynthesis, uroporphyrinogen III synthase, partial [Cystobasidium minutum MCA 4210]|uniref:tetrapyrrole biosynthesis, uroporphyrinogen III synthase n=1 Tax=Cystobasidium minutum MCA 4210 TaxID=1397322 RepID=UPI0034CFABE0
VLVLKEKNNNGKQDPYEVALKKAGYSAHFLPVLSHRLVNLESIQHVISGTPLSNEKYSPSYSGVVFTSQRAVEAWATAGQAIIDSDTSSDLLAGTDLPFYAVGPATSFALQRLDERLRPPSSLILGAEETGNAVKLASYIVSRQESCYDASQHSLPLLYLGGDKRKDTLSSLLKQGNITMHEIEAYETFPSPTFEADYAALEAYGHFEWIVFFSPSGAKLLLPLLPQKTVDKSPRFAAIGPTTRDYLLSQAGVEVSAMAESPNPDSLITAM